jgi:hypothetical protein
MSARDSRLTARAGISSGSPFLFSPCEATDDGTTPFSTRAPHNGDRGTHRQTV